MKVAGILRGFPGLGRVMPGLSLLSLLQAEYNCQCAVYTYGQGSTALPEFQLATPLEITPDHCDITAIGLNPVTKNGAKILNFFLEEKPDLILLDGEPLLTKAFSLCMPKAEIISLLNPMDLDNKCLPESTILYFRDCFLSCGRAIVHGLQPEWGIKRIGDCTVLFTHTILRPNLVRLKTFFQRGKKILCVLGGGVMNSSSKFLRSTIKMGKLVLSIAPYFPDYTFMVCCNSKVVASALKQLPFFPNIDIVENYLGIENLYQDAATVICRAGRNVISELLYLGIPSILLPCEDDFRKDEQNNNIKTICNQYAATMHYATTYMDKFRFASILEEVLQSSMFETNFMPGNRHALQFIMDP